MGKSKFKVGDKVRFKNKSKIYTIGSVEYDVCDKRNIYTLKECPKTYFIYSYQLEKVDKTLKCGAVNENTSKSTVILEFEKTALNTIDPVNKFKNCANKVMVDGVIVKNRYGNVDENTRTFKLTLKEAQEMYNAGGKLREFALRVFTEDELKPKPKYPKTWEDYCDNFYPYEKHMHYTPEFAHGFTKEDCNALIAYGRLIRLRRAWIGDWCPDWESEERHNNWVINYELKPKREELGKGPRVSNWGFMYHIMPLSFPTEEMANKFLSCFKDLLEKAKGLY